MADKVSDALLRRLRSWGIYRVFGFPGDGINGIIGAFNRAGNDPEFIQARHEEMAAFMAVGHAKFTGEVGCVHAPPPAREPSTCSTVSTTPGSTTNRSWRSSASRPPPRSGSNYQQEIDLVSLYKDVAGEYLQMVTSPEQLRHGGRPGDAHRRRGAHGHRLIIPNDVQELDAVDQAAARVQGQPGKHRLRMARASSRRTSSLQARRRGAQRRRDGWRSWWAKAPGARPTR